MRACCPGFWLLSDDAGHVGAVAVPVDRRTFGVTDRVVAGQQPVLTGGCCESGRAWGTMPVSSTATVKPSPVVAWSWSGSAPTRLGYSV